jgi:hypothetical protein
MYTGVHWAAAVLMATLVSVLQSNKPVNLKGATVFLNGIVTAGTSFYIK